jgi:hypothetical protein
MPSILDVVAGLRSDLDNLRFEIDRCSDIADKLADVNGIAPQQIGEVSWQF